jgi:hypothetical protein
MVVAWIGEGAFGAPLPPTGLTADVTAPDTVTLDWNDVAGTSYYVVLWKQRAQLVNEPYLNYGIYNHYSKFVYDYYWRDDPLEIPRETVLGNWHPLSQVTLSAHTHTYTFGVSPSYSDYTVYSEHSREKLIGRAYSYYSPYSVYCVIAVDSAGNKSLASPEVYPVWIAADRFLAPDNVKVTPGSGGSVTVSWDSVTGADNYEVWRKRSDGFDPTKLTGASPHFGSLPHMSYGNYWAYTTYFPYHIYHRYELANSTTSGSLAIASGSIYGAYYEYPFYAAYTPYGIYKVIALKNSDTIRSPTSAESRVVPSGVSDLATVGLVQTSQTTTVSVTDSSSAIANAAIQCGSGDLSRNTVVSIGVVSSGTAYSTALPSSKEKRGSHIEFDLGGASLAATVTITIPLPSGTAAADVTIYHFVNGAWQEESTNRVNGSSSVSVDVSTLSAFVLGVTPGNSSSGGGAGGGGGGGGGCFIRHASR